MAPIRKFYLQKQLCLAGTSKRFASTSTRRRSVVPTTEAAVGGSSRQASTISTPHYPRGYTRTLSEAAKGAAEGEFLQEPVEETWSSEGITPFPAQPIPRYNWRHRAKSRVKKTEGTVEEPKNYKRRTRKVTTEFSTDNDKVFKPAIERYSNKFNKLLLLEEAQDEAALRDRLAQWGLPRLQQEGYCLTGMGAYWLEANQFGRPVATFSLGPGIILPENKFENGSQVLISRLDPLTEAPYTGSVLARTQTQLRICFPNQFDIGDGVWRMDLGRPNLIYERMRQAITHLEGDPVETMKLVPEKSTQYILEGTQVRDVILKSFMTQTPPNATLEADGPVAGLSESPVASTAQVTDLRTFDGAFKHDQRILSWAKRYSQPNPIVMNGDPPLDGLNDSQKKAMATMIGERFSLTQGPPGTGKTKTIIETVKVLKVHFEVPHPLLICTYTNVAVDNLVDGFVKAGVKPLRIGYQGTIKSSLVPYSLDYQLEKHALNDTLKKLLEDSTSVQEGISDLSERYNELEKKVENGKPRKPRKDTVQRMINMKEGLVKLETKAKLLKSRIFSTQQKMLGDVFAEADVVCTTCITSACYAMNISDFPVVFIDEASMSTEPASLIPLMKGSEHVALIGDHKQLPPVIVSHRAKEEGFGVSLFERLIEEGHVPSVMLDIQYRMHPDISRFPAKEFYDLALLDGTVDAVGNALPGLEPLNSKHTSNHEKSRPSVIFLDHSGHETYQGKSLINVTEGHIVASVVEDLLLNNPTLKGSDIGIIAPYAAQIKLLTRFLHTHPVYQDRFQSVLGDRAREVSSVEIKTVDGFEGREKPAIVFSTVRNNDSGHIGFLSDRKRLNVGLTRAKRCLFVVGSISTLRQGKQRMTQSRTVVGKGAESWRRYTDFLMEGDMVVPLAGNALDLALYEHMEAATARKRKLLPSKPLKVAVAG